MKRLFFTATVAILASCNSNQPVQTETAKPAIDSAVLSINSPYNVSYSSKFVIGSSKNAETILTLWKDYDNGNLSAHKESFADSIELYLADGSKLHSSRDSIIAIIQKHRNMFSAVSDRVDAVTSLKSTDKNQDWVLVWGMETDIDKKGKVDSVNLMETWRLNKDGKADLVYQFNQVAATPKK